VVEGGGNGDGDGGGGDLRRFFFQFFFPIRSRSVNVMVQSFHWPCHVMVLP